MFVATPAKTIGQTARLVQDTAVEIAWEQWAGLGAGVMSPERFPASITDPEALLLLSLVVRGAERRLADLIAWWARVGSPLLSVQRTKTMLKSFPESAASGLPEFAFLAHESGDRRWSRFASPGPPAWAIRGPKGAQTLRLAHSSALMVRLRAGFGVNAKSDALCFLLGIGGAEASADDIARAVGYSTVAVRAALKDMVLARLIDETNDRPIRYFVRPGAWSHLLALNTPKGPEPPAWAYWHPVHGFLAGACDLFSESSDLESTYVVSSKARALATRFAPAFSKNRIAVPRPDDYPGAAYLGAFHETVASLRAWAREQS